MKLALVLFSLLATAAATAPAFASSGKCAQFAGRPAVLHALELLAEKMQLSQEELCNRPGLADIHATKKNILNEKMEVIPHHWITLHYGEYSCQYFFREADFVVTAQNCYNTW